MTWKIKFWTHQRLFFSFRCDQSLLSEKRRLFPPVSGVSSETLLPVCLSYRCTTAGGQQNLPRRWDTFPSCPDIDTHSSANLPQYILRTVSNEQCIVQQSSLENNSQPDEQVPDMQLRNLVVSWMNVFFDNDQRSIRYPAYYTVTWQNYWENLSFWQIEFYNSDFQERLFWLRTRTTKFLDEHSYCRVENGPCCLKRLSTAFC